MIEYPDKTCKGILLCKNRFHVSDFTTDGLCHETPVKGKIPREWDNERTVNPRLLEKYAAPNMPIPGDILWSRIVQSYEQIPVVKIHQTSSLDEVYLDLARRAIELADNASSICGRFLNSEERYYIPASLFREVAEAHNYKPNDLKAELDMAGLLIKDRGGRGYQYSKRVSGAVIRFYVLRKLTRDNKTAREPVITNCENIAFETKGMTQVERVEKRLADYQKLVHDVAERYNLSADDLAKLML